MELHCRRWLAVHGAQNLTELFLILKKLSEISLGIKQVAFRPKLPKGLIYDSRNLRPNIRG